MSSPPHSPLAQASTGYRATLVSQALRMAAKLVGIAVLARLVRPEEHGQFALAATVTMLLALLRDLGTGTAAVQAPTLSGGQQAALFRLHLLLGAGLAVAALGLAPWAARFYREPALVPLLQMMSASFLLNGCGAWPRAMLARELRFAAINRIELWGALAGTAAMIAAAMAGAGAASFAWFLLVSEAVLAALAWRAPSWRPRDSADWSALRPLMRTSTAVTAHGVLAHVLSQIDLVVLGWSFGSASAGFYSRAGQLLMQPTLLIAAPFNGVLLATLSRLTPASPLFAAHLRETTNLIAHLTLPAVALCVAIPEEIVGVVLGRNWPEAAPLLRWLAVGSIATLMGATIPALCVAGGKASRLPWMTAAHLGVAAIALTIGLPAGPTGIAVAIACTNLALLVPRWTWAIRETSLAGAQIVGSMVGPLGQSIALGLGAWAVREVSLRWFVHPALLLLTATLGGTIAYAAATLARPGTRRELVQGWKTLIAGRNAA